MRITSKRVGAIIQRHEYLINLADQFLRSKEPNGGWRSDIRFNYDHIEEYVNSSCHCHPSCSWVKQATVEEFGKWLDAQPQ